MSVNTLALPSKIADSWLRSATLTVLASLIISLFATVAIPLPFTPVPIATQGIVILILSALLGPKRGPAAVLGFLAQGAAGLPVFAGGVGGMAKLFGPTGGYLFGYVIGAFVVGYFVERMRERSSLNLFGILALGNAMFFLFGVPYLSLYVGLKKAVLLGFAPFLVGDLLKLSAAVKLVQWLGLDGVKQSD